MRPYDPEPILKVYIPVFRLQVTVLMVWPCFKPKNIDLRSASLPEKIGRGFAAKIFFRFTVEFWRIVLYIFYTKNIILSTNSKY